MPRSHQLRPPGNARKIFLLRFLSVHPGDLLVSLPIEHAGGCGQNVHGR